MLTGQLIRARVRGSSIEASFIDAEQPKLVAFAEQVVAHVEDATAQSANRAQLLETLDTLYGDDRQQKLLNGIVKIALDRCEAALYPPMDSCLALRRGGLSARQGARPDLGGARPAPSSVPVAAGISTLQSWPSAWASPATALQPKHSMPTFAESHRLTGHPSAWRELALLAGTTWRWYKRCYCALSSWSWFSSALLSHV